VSLEEGAKLEPYVRAQSGILESPTTGIIDSHAYMQYLLGSFLEQSGDIAYNATVISISPLSPSGYTIAARDGSTGEETSFSSSTVINSAGLGACAINNMLLPIERHITPFYAKGNYFSYSTPTPRTSRLIYPAPQPGLGGLGTHLTLDISGAIRFGPDIEWVSDPSNLAVNIERLPEAIREIKKYLPDVQEDRLMPDYAGIRPKLGPTSAVSSGKGFRDFVIRREDGFEGFVNLLGIESPGLTASLAIAEEVERLLYR
jgi:2-hydroxyglutarate dehydrogenase